MKWYTGTAIFRHLFKDKNRIPQYEERTVHISAANEEEAESKMLNDISEYSGDGVVLVEQYEIKETYDPPGDEPIEVASHMRVSSMAPDEFIEKYCSDLRPKSCAEKGWKHVWYQMDENKISCYNCGTSKAGTLKKSK